MTIQDVLKTRTTLSVLCRTTSWLFLKTEPLSGNAQFGRWRTSNCPFHMSSINRTSAAHRALYITNAVQTVYVLRLHRPSFIHMTQVLLSCKTFNRSVVSCNKVLLWRYRSTMHHTLHTIPQKNYCRDVSDLVIMEVVLFYQSISLDM